MKMKKITCMLTVMALTAAFTCGCGNTGAQTTDSMAQSEEPEASGELAASEAEEGAAAETVTQTPEIMGYKLLWSDEFDGDTLDETKWTRELRDPGWTNNELQEYTDSDENIFLRDGCLVLKAVKSEVDGETYYTSGKVNSQNKQDFQYGKVVVKAKVPEGQGLWPAIWMMPQDEGRYGQWPKCGEIDIMEVLGNDTATSYSTIHYGEPHAEQQGTITLNDDSFSDRFHIYCVEWEPGEIRFYTDGEKVLTVNDWYSAIEDYEFDYPAPFDQPFFVQMNLAVGGDWPGNPDDSTDFDNAEFEIDYVRVYQLEEYDTNVTKPVKEFREADESGNYIHNGNFEEAEALDDEEDWSFLKFSEGVGDAAIEDGAIVISTDNAGTEEYSIQLVQPGLTMLKGHKYQVNFDIKSDEERDGVVCVSAPTAGWIRYLNDTTIDIGTDWQTYTFEFDMTEKDDNNGRLEFNLGNHGYTSTVYITNVSVVDITE